MLSKILLKNQILAKQAPKLASVPQATFSSELFKEKEHGEEIIYFNKQDWKTMKRLYSKLKAQIAYNELHKHKEEAWAAGIDEDYEKHRRNLKVVLKNLGIKENRVLLNDLMEWKKVIHD